MQFLGLEKISGKILTSQSTTLQSTNQITNVETNLKEPLTSIQSLALKPLLIAALAVSIETPTENIIIRLGRISLLH